VGQQLHRALEVGEEHGDLLPFPFQGGLGGKDLLGEVGWGVRLGRWGDHRGCSGERGSTLSAEGKSRRVGKTACRTRTGEWRGTLPAKLHPRRILKSAARAAHWPSPWR